MPNQPDLDPTVVIPLPQRTLAAIEAGENAGDLARYPRFRALWRGSGCLSGKHPQGVRRIRRAAKPPTATQ